MNPSQQGEVFVTEDYGETDLDLGHYERLIHENLHRESSVTTGSIYSTVLAKERRGEYVGDTLPVLPHITNEIKEWIRRLATERRRRVITEVGGTVGDIEDPALPRRYLSRPAPPRRSDPRPGPRRVAPARQGEPLAHLHS